MTGTTPLFRALTATRSMHACALRALIAAAALLLAFPASGAEDAGATVAKPQVKVGDRWTYRVTPLVPKRPAFTADTRVVSTGPDEIVVVNKQRDKEGESDSFYTSEWNAISTSTWTFTPLLGHFKFPLKVGASHVAVWEALSKGSGWNGKLKADFKVTGWEEVTVPAGKFRALKLEGYGSYVRLDQPGTGWVRYGYWYVPEVKRFVKYAFETGPGTSTSPSTSDAIELVEFSVQ